MVSVFLSLLAHGTVFFYLGSVTLQERSEAAAPGKGVKVAVVRGKNSLPNVPEPPSTEVSVSPQKPTVRVAGPLTPKAIEPVPPPRQPRLPRTSPATQAPSASGRVEKQPPAAASSVQQKQPLPPTTQDIAESAKQADSPLEAVSELSQTGSSGPALATDSHRSDIASKQREGELNQIEQSYMDDLVAAIERHKRYPLRARKKGYEGEVRVLFTVLKDGTIANVEIVSSSHWSILDRAASRAVLDLGRFKRIPPQLGRDQWEFQLPIRFAMN